MFDFKPKWEVDQKPIIAQSEQTVDGSTFKVPLTTILSITNHPNADRLDLVTVYGFQCVVQKNKYQIGDRVIYVPIDSVISEWLEKILFPEGSKITLNKRRVKQIRIRKFPSLGMIVDLKDIESKVDVTSLQLEQDLSAILDIKKYEPPTPKFQSSLSGPRLRDKPFTNPYFRCYNGVDHLKWYPNAFEGEEVVIQCKLHGTHIRWGKAPFVPNTLWKKIKNLFGLCPKYEEVWGSNNVEITNQRNYKGFYGDDVYSACLKKLNVFEKTKEGEFWHAEMIGPGVQKGYTYGHDEHHIVAFDVRIMQPDGTQRWLNPEEAEVLAKERGFDFVPVLYKGPYDKKVVEQCSTGPSVYCPSEKVREGCVVKLRYNYDSNSHKKALKVINPVYLDGDHGDNH